MKLKGFFARIVILTALSGLPVRAQTPIDPHALSVEKFSAPIQNLDPKSIDTLLGQGKKVPPPTPVQIDEAFKIYDQCKASDMMQRFYDCDCISSKYLEIRPMRPADRIEDLTDVARKYCGNSVNIAGDAYTSCLGWASQTRSDTERYCGCYGNAYAKNFTKNPTDSIRGREILMTAAMNSCKTGTEIAESNALQRVIDYLKKSGLYSSFFPGASPGPPPERKTPRP